MAHKCLVGGTAYDIVGGKCLVGGTAYSITGGKTLVGGTGYDISFVSATFDEIMADIDVLVINGRNASSTSTLRAILPNGLSQSGIYYVFQLYYGYLTISKVYAEYVDANSAANLTVTVLKQTGTNTYAPHITSQTTMGVQLYAYISSNGADNTSVYGGTILIAQFPSYPTSLVDKVLSSITLTRKAGRNASSTQTVNTTFTASERFFVGHNAYAAYSSPVGTVIYGNNTSNPSLLRLVSGTAYISTNGTSNASVYGGSIVAVTE